MTNKEIYEKYGPEEGQRRIDAKNAKTRAWHEKHPGYVREYQVNNRQHINEVARKYQSGHREVQQKRVNNYHGSMSGRAMNLLTSYRQADIEKFGVYPELNREDIINKCFSEGSKCVWCGCTDWKKLGLDRISTEYPHHVWNCMCACRDCNTSRHIKPIDINLKRLNMSFDDWLEKNDGKESQGLTICY